MYDEFTPEYLKQRILADTDTSISTIEGSFAHDMASGVAYNLYELWQELDALYSLIFFSGLCGEYLDMRCAEYGLERSAGSKATGSIIITTRFDTTIPAGTYFTSESGYEYVTTQSIATENNTVTVEIEAKEIGAAYNAAQSEVIRATVAIAGATAVTLDTAITGGADDETDDSLRTRLYAYIRAAGSGCINDYITWAKEVQGVGTVLVLSCWNGAGTVKVLIADGNETEASDALVSEVAAHIETKRPIGSVVTVCSVATTAINVSAHVTVETDYTLESIAEEFEAALTVYFKECARSGDDIKYSRVGAILMSIEGVTDYASLSVCGGAANVTIGAGHIPACGEVTLS